MKRQLSLFYVTASILLFSCEKYLEIDQPANRLTREAVFSNDNTATAAVLAIYANMEATGLAYNKILSFGIASDDFINYRTSTDPVAMATNNLTPENGIVATQWNSHYNYIYQANALLEGLQKSVTVSEPVRRQLQGEALFIRAWFHFYLVNYFGNVPYNTTTDYEVTRRQPQESATTIYPKIIDDLKTSKALLAGQYVRANNLPTSERTRPNKFVAGSLLARVCLYHADWTNAEKEVDSILSSGGMFSINASLANVFLKNNMEAVWQLQPVVAGYNTYGGAYLQPGTGIPNSVSLSKNLVDSFELGDLRKTEWIKPNTVAGKTYFWWYKYKKGQNETAITEYTTLIRLPELYLIRAEARAMQENLTGALSDLNMVRTRAGLAALSNISKDQILDAVSKERRLELFGEYDDRWLDLKRTGRIDAVLSAVKGADWTSTDQYFPIPLTEMLRHPGMIQNPGY